MCLKAWWGRWGGVGNAVFTCSKLVGMACGNEKRHRLCKNASQDGDTLVRILFKKYGWSWSGLMWRCCNLWCGAVCVCVCVYLFLRMACVMIEIQMASWQSICKRLRFKHFSLGLCSPCQAHETEIKTQRDNRPNNKQTIAHCAVVNSNEAMGPRVVSHTLKHTQPNQVGHWQWQSQGRPMAALQLFVCGANSNWVWRELWMECNVCVRLHLPSKRRAF